MPLKARAPLSLLLLGAWLAACSAGGGGRQKPDAVVTEHTDADLSAVVPLLEMSASLPQLDPARQAEVFQAAKDAASLTPTTTNKLRYALALATPGHSGSDPVAAQRQLSSLLARPETLLPAERSLAMVELGQVEQRLVLASENKRQRDDTPRDAHDDDRLAAANKRLAAETDENARLRKQLDEARAKLEAVTHIERSINDRGAAEAAGAAGTAAGSAKP